MHTIHILDTSTIICDPFCFKTFKDTTVVIPVPVLEELDKLKSYADETGKNARTFLRSLDQLIAQSPTPAHVGIKLADGLIVKIDVNIVHNDTLGSALYGDNRILSYALQLTKSDRKAEVILVSKDIGLRVRANAYGIVAIDYIASGRSLNDDPAEHKAIELSDNEINDFYKRNVMDVSDELIAELGLKANDAIVLVDESRKDVGLGRFNADTKCVKALNRIKNLFGISAKNVEQQFAIDLLLDNDVKLVTLAGRAGTGKAQPLDAKILTPTGWTTMGEIKINDLVSTPDGKFSKVLGVFPQGKIDIYKVEFNDRTSTECCDNHLWFTQTNLDRNVHRAGSVKTTKEIRENLLTKKSKKRVHSIPTTQPIEMNEFETDPFLDPYAFGCLLGDGSFRHALTLTSADLELVEDVNNSLNKIDARLVKIPSSDYGYNIIGLNFKAKNSQEVIASKNGQIVKIYNDMHDIIKDGYSKHTIYKSINKKPAYGLDWSYGDYHSSSPILEYLRKNDLWMKKSEGKFIPNDYKFASIKNRILLLQGLMDTDGSASVKGDIEYSSVSRRLADDVQWLIQSLGGIATMSVKQPTFTYKGVKKLGQLSYRLRIKNSGHIDLFRLKRKIDLVRERTKYSVDRFITNVEYIGQKDAQCILIDHPQHLYLTNDCIVTHNTLIACAAALYNLLERADKRYEKVIITKSMVSVGREMGFLPGSAQEKMAPFVQSYFDNINFLMKNSKHGKHNKTNQMDPYISLMIENGTIEIEAIAFLRGRTLPNAFIIIDEIQNISHHELKTILTRVGEGSKIVLIGDSSQIDNNKLAAGSNALDIAINRFAGHQIAGSVILTRGERSALATLSSEIL